MLEFMLEILPIGPEEWQVVENKVRTAFPPGRTRDSINRKYSTLHRKNTPTGNPNCPPEIRLAKTIKKELGIKANIGDGEEEFDLESGYSSTFESTQDDVLAVAPVAARAASLPFAARAASPAALPFAARTVAKAGLAKAIGRPPGFQTLQERFDDAPADEMVVPAAPTLYPSNSTGAIPRTPNPSVTPSKRPYHHHPRLSNNNNDFLQTLQMNFLQQQAEAQEQKRDQADARAREEKKDQEEREEKKKKDQEEREEKKAREIRCELRDAQFMQMFAVIVGHVGQVVGSFGGPASASMPTPAMPMSTTPLSTTPMSTTPMSAVSAQPLSTNKKKRGLAGGLPDYIYATLEEHNRFKLSSKRRENKTQIKNETQITIDSESSVSSESDPE